MRSPGRGASQASAGILAPYTEAHERTPLLEMGTRSLALFDDFVGGAAARSGRPVEYARTGTLEIALNENDEFRLRASRAWLNGIGVRTEWLTAADVRDLEPAVNSAVVGGLLNRAHGWAGVMSLVTALTESANLAGAFFETPVEAV